MILLIDNYDSFVHNLARHFQRLGQETLVLRNDAVTPQEVRALAPAAVVFSPGPCAPAESGYSMSIVRQLHGKVPMLGVCQAIRRSPPRWERESSGPLSRATAARRRSSTRDRACLPASRRRSRSAAIIRW